MNKVAACWCFPFCLLQEFWWSSLQLRGAALGDGSVFRVLQSVWGGQLQGERCCEWKGFCLPFPRSCWFCSHPLQNKRENPIHIINVSIKTADTEDDDALVTAFTEFAQSKVGFHPDLVDSDIVSVFMMELKILYFFLVFILQKAVLFEYGIRRITFLIAQKVKPTVSCLYIATYCS